MTAETVKKVTTWLLGDDVGLSSKYLASLALGNETNEINYPHDPSDLGRCLRFLDLLEENEAVEVLKLASDRSERWRALCANWHEIVALYNEGKSTGCATRCYLKMQKVNF